MNTNTNLNFKFYVILFKIIFYSLIIIFLFFSINQVVFAIPNINTNFFYNFNDDFLNKYIMYALENNHDLKSTEFKVEQYRQNIKISFSNELPALSSAANYLGFHVPKIDNFTLSQNSFVLPFFAHYEADFLLKNKDKTKSSKKLYESVLYDEKSIYISLLGDVASTYINILQYDYLIKNQEIIVKNSFEILNRTIKKFNYEVISTVELNESKKDYETKKSILISLKKQRDILLMQFTLLCGLPSDQYNNILRSDFKKFDYHSKIPIQVNSDVIFSRPDVLSAEKSWRNLK